MNKLTSAAVAALLLVSFGAAAEVEMSKRAYIVSVDTKARTVKFRAKDDEGAWKEFTATWDDKTEWADGSGGPDKPATAALAGQLKKDAKIFIAIDDDNSGQEQWRVESLSTMPPSSDMN